MSRKIIITETQEQQLLEHLIMEKTYPIDPTKVLHVKKYLDNHFERLNLSQFGNDGMPTNTPVVGVAAIVNGERKTVKNFTARQLFDILEHEFRGMFSDKIERSKFLAQVIKDWYAKKITDDGLLSKTNC
jgi:hypothetical protein